MRFVFLGARMLCKIQKYRIEYGNYILSTEEDWYRDVNITENALILGVNRKEQLACKIICTSTCQSAPLFILSTDRIHET